MTALGPRLHALRDAPENTALPDDLSQVLGESERAAFESAGATLGPIFATAPYLRDLAIRHAQWFAGVLEAGPEAAFSQLIADMISAGSCEAEEELSRRLRVGKARGALLSAVAEIGGVWTARETTRCMSDLADAALQAALDFLMAEAGREDKLAQPAEQASAANSGLAIFALGKHGGQELNYSSDIDIVAFYDPMVAVLPEDADHNKFYVRIIRRLVSIMQDRTAEGYVFRTDVRLRPDPGSTPVAISFDAALGYYESRGQNWERAAWIKARPCAGDIGVGNQFLKELAPFIWRKHLDFAMIADIQAMKRQINIHRKVGEQRVLGHNVKLGRGGIREIEFFVQTQQLIAGGRDPDLRVRPTVKALAALVEGKWISPEAARDLEETYWFLRAVENRLQMLRDEQTHVMPETEEGVGEIALLMGYENREAFEADYRAALARVSDYYAELFSEGESLSGELGNLVFTGSDDDPDTLETLANLGFSDPAAVSATIRKWHYGGYAATRAAKAREHLTELIPGLLKTFAGSGNADIAFARFNDFLTRLPAGVQMFALLRNHAHLRQLLLDFMSSAPRLAEAVIHRAHVVDGLIDPHFAGDIATSDSLVANVDAFLAEARSFEDLIDRARIIGQEQKFLIAAGLVGGALSAQQAGRQFTALAETLLARLFAAVRENFAQRHGTIAGARVGLLGFGKMASREMTLTSDLDFILLYDVPEGTAGSDGERELDVATYFTRLTQRLVAAISAPTAEGVLYEADMRLRPSGNAGPLATSLKRFRTYQSDEAWTWEHLALTRARVAIGDEGLAETVGAEISRIMALPRDRAKIVGDVLDMRALMARERPPRHPFDLKLHDGGLVDLEFIAQTAQLLEGEKLDVPQAPPAKVLLRLAETGILPQGERLAEIHAIYATILQLMSACLVDPLKDEGWTPAFRELVARRANYPDFLRLEADIIAMRAEVSEAAARFYEKMKA
ncbi:bifunctional [glutamine synthetase] adenylyltransferase/[glutamine synthetase]-adenylyl-L-tyrosine phosphorylase [Pelagibacterium halotolerans]|uniref:Bifunctional glutamine synthetase adenylyltransferase/adenylyl-removing enzyme n=1 Tax=Pelagibacterium halotolerans (strain DSM 22347 / JCM 15775 / CGMCC 1.7692 / B2) TaxID=1082931 RepID=G4RE35_PELHB|nr:bifunctional [glutamine synthetase] adenylyltransferase/[glutamine synthetase]-adenylyl-L-tyrosine phosphorylase [Pelagibacterium halotolerans]AEQ50829.1 glutamate-ammonia-ligase adenylyltransferase [Pelagibacterium halotolerans B2]QJR19257.1 bifunctional [glutamine synthetase] adenylyltransferase/[glutamine synthetase]-adenylyl-L-tyrosine phosphorylase [Pelagibacterium halotolerans]SDZ97265.1 glutamate-ammonia-ligase adenylyltransferase [Pelagibacterium halotolerans]